MIQYFNDLPSLLDKIKKQSWDLTSIYPSLDSDEYKNDISKMLELFAKQKQDLQSPQIESDFCGWLKDFVQDINQCWGITKTISNYAYALYSIEIENSSYLNNLSQIEKYLLESRIIDNVFSKILLKNQKKIPEFFKQYPEFEDYEFLLQEFVEDAKHEMDSELEKLAGELNQTGANAWSILQEQIISNLTDTDGNSFNSIKEKAFCADPQERKLFWHKEKELLKQNQIPLAACLNNLKGQKVILNKRKNWNQAIENSLHSNRCSKETLDALISAINQTLPQWQEYFQTKAALLRKRNLTASETAGTKEDPGIAFYDLFAPVENPVEKQVKTQCENAPEKNLTQQDWTFESAISYIAQKFSEFSKEMGDFVIDAKNKKWINANISFGTVEGAYNEDFPKGHQSRIFLNSSGDFDDVVTLAHELGHAYHFRCLKGKPVMFFNPPMPLAETASIFGETIVKQDLLKSLEGSQKISALDKDLQDTAQILIDILSCYYFEESVFAEREKGELNHQDFCHLMANAQEKTYGPGLNSERHEYMWAVISHYYIPDFDFYNYPYVFGQLFAAALYTKSEAIGPGFDVTFKQLLSQTGNLSCEDLCRKFGFDITKKEFWLDSIKIYLQEIEEFKTLVQQCE